MTQPYPLIFVRKYPFTHLRSLQNGVLDLIVLEAEAVGHRNEQVLVALIQLVSLRFFLFF